MPTGYASQGRELSGLLSSFAAGAQPHSFIPRLTSKCYSETSVMADFSQVNTEECSVCKTKYPTCLTCKKYGSKHKHSLDGEKSKNAHDNPSYVNDAGNPQSHWNGKESNQKSKNIILFYFQNNMWFGFLLLLSFLGINISFPLHIGNIGTPLNDPYSTRGGTLSTNQFESNLYCSCTCISRPTTMGKP